LCSECYGGHTKTVPIFVYFCLTIPLNPLIFLQILLLLLFLTLSFVSFLFISLYSPRSYLLVVLFRLYFLGFLSLCCLCFIIFPSHLHTELSFMLTFFFSLFPNLRLLLLHLILFQLPSHYCPLCWFSLNSFAPHFLLRVSHFILLLIILLVSPPLLLQRHCTSRV
jgi:hypothetical protein